MKRWSFVQVWCSSREYVLGFCFIFRTAAQLDNCQCVCVLTVCVCVCVCCDFILFSKMSALWTWRVRLFDKIEHICCVNISFWYTLHSVVWLAVLAWTFDT
jgi:hypothetical protein